MSPEERIVSLEERDRVQTERRVSSVHSSACSCD
jgi:hypothetical protein